MRSDVSVHADQSNPSSIQRFAYVISTKPLPTASHACGDIRQILSDSSFATLKRIATSNETTFD